MRTLVHLFVLVGVIGTASAEDRVTGVQPEAPAPEAPSPDISGKQEANHRQAIRGCPADQDCRPYHEQLRDFELEAFPPPGGDPWITGGDDAGGSLIEKVGTATAPEMPASMKDLELPDLPVRWDQRVLDYLSFYKEDRRGRNIMRGWLEAQGQYGDMILAALEKNGLPEDLLYVAMIESGYDTYSYSRAGASGLWQFMPSSGEIYGLTINRWVDERNDPIRATQAACDHWKDLYQRFGDWDLALAAYNAGYGNVIRAISRYNTNDFWQLLEYESALPWESSIYVPKAIAAAIVGHNREEFGFDDVEVEKAEEWDDVTVTTSVSLSVIAKAAGTTAAVIKRLNPALVRGRTPPGETYVVRIPKGAGDQFAAKFAQLRGDWDGYDAYVMAHGERFEDVATMFGISKKKLMALNEMEAESEVSGGAVLVVPQISEAERKKNKEKAEKELYASGVDQKDGEPLIVAVPDKDAYVEGKRRIFYRVVSGDGLEKVAKALGVKRKLLAEWNGLELEAKLQARMILQAWVDEDFDEEARNVALLDETRILVVTRGSKEHLDLNEQRLGRVRVEYTAQKRESFEEIGKKYGLGPRDLARINRMPHTTVLEKGDTIIVYEVVDKDRSDRAKKQWKKMPKKKKGKKGKHKAEVDEDEMPPAEEEEVAAIDEVDTDGPVTSPDQVE